MYSSDILEHFKNPHNQGEIKTPSFSVSEINTLCGDALKLDVLIEENIIKDIKFKSSGCAISTASASLLTDYLIGKNVSEIKELDEKFVQHLLGGQLTPARIKCAMVALNALKKI